MEQKLPILRRIGRFLYAEALAALFAKAWPMMAGIAIGGWAAVEGVLGGVPLVFVISAAALSFGAVTGGLYAARSYWAQTTVKWKLKIGVLTPIIQITQRISTGKRTLKGVGLQLDVENLASFPVIYKVVRAFASIEDRINPNPMWVNDGCVVAAHSADGFKLPVIPMTGAIPSQLSGRLEIEMLYGRKVARHPLKRSYAFTIYLNPDGSVQSIARFDVSG